MWLLRKINASVAELLDEVMDEGFKSSLMMMIADIKEDSDETMNDFKQ